MKSSYRSWRSLVSLLIFVLQIFIFTCVFISQKTNSQSHDTSGKRYEEGYCSMYDICGQRSDGKVLNCPNGSRSIKPNNMLSLKIQSLCPTITGNACCTEEQFSTLRQQVQQAIPLLVGCPACLRNFLNLFCELTCSPNQSLFINVTSISEVNKSWTVDGIEYFVTEYFAKELYNSCKDVKFGSTNMRAMDFIGAGAQNYKDWFAFLGRQAGLNQIGSPYSITFQSKIINSSLAKPMNVSAYSCGDSTLGCSCGDCQSSPECSDFSPLSLPKKSKCSTKIGSLEVTCIELSSTVLYIILISIFLLWVLLYKKRKRTSPSPINQHFRDAREGIGSHSPDKKAKSNSQSQDLIEDHNQVYRLKSSLIQDYLSIWFRWYGKWVARNPILVLCFSLAIPLLLSLGLIHFRVETRPEKLWVGSGSKAAEDKQFFDSHLAPFYRIEQLILATISDTKNGEQPRILNDKNMQLLFEIQKKIDGLKVNYSGSVVSLSDICLNPLGNACATQSVLQYYKMDPKKYNELGGVDHVKYCFEHYSSADACLSAFKAPLDPSTALGGFEGKNYSEASSFIITYPVNNKFDSTSSANGKAMSWEKAFIRLIKEEIKPMVNSHNLSISFSSESSIQEELKRNSSADVITILVSYILMSVYISFALADIPNFSSFFISSKALLGFSGIVVVILSVLGSAGFFSAIGIKSTLIIMEVIPFLVLAVGVDNMCILVHAVKRQPLDLPLEETISNALVEVGPSITLASLSEVVAFAVGSFIPMPACRVFSMFAALAVFLDFLLQISAFLSLIVFDFLRAQDNRIDCFPCIKVQSSNPNNNVTRERKRGFLSRYMKDIHAPILGLFWVKIIVVIVFTAAAFSSIALCTRIQPGLEQKIVLPQDSYLQDYFDDLTDYLRIGPPLYFVVKNFNYSMESRQTNQLCSISQCDSGSLLNEIARASLTSELSYIAKPAASWLDDFLIWLSPEAFSCCRKFTNGSYCPPNDQPPCCSSSDRSCNLGTVCKDCTTCFLHSDLQKGRPSTLQFKEKLPWFLNSSPSADCAKGGIGAYTSNLNLSDYQSGIISASAFRTYHPPLNKQVDYVKALRAARDFSAKMTDSLKIEIFPYSVFYIFFEQYLDIWKSALVNLSICLGAVFIVCLIITSSFWSSAIILVVLTMIVLDIMGIMALLGIQLNAISVVNLVMSVGIAVEFCVHIMHAFLISSGDREKRASKSLNTMGASVFSGITLTKLVGVVVLRMARSEIFVIYYFQMYLALVLIGFLHGLIFLPVVLSLCGPPSRNNHIEDVQND